MRPLRTRAAALVFCSCLGLFTTACDRSPDGDDAVETEPTQTTAAPGSSTGRTIEVTLAGGQVSGGPRRESVRLGEQVRIRAVSDVPEELHVHTYEHRRALQPGQPGEVAFTASIAGRHEVEFEKSGKQAVTLVVA